MRFSEANGQKVVSTSDAVTVAKVAGFVVDPKTAQVVALRLKKTEGDADLLLWTGVASFGPDAVTVASPEALTRSERGDLTRPVVGARLLSERGVELGEVKDVEFDPATGAVRALLTKRGEIAGDRMMGLGSYALVVSAD